MTKVCCCYNDDTTMWCINSEPSPNAIAPATPEPTIIDESHVMGQQLQGIAPSVINDRPIT